MVASIIVKFLTDPRQSLNGLTVQDFPGHSNTKQLFPSTIVFACESGLVLGSSIGISLGLGNSATKAYMFSFGISNPLSLPSRDLSSEK